MNNSKKNHNFLKIGLKGCIVLIIIILISHNGAYGHNTSVLFPEQDRKNVTILDDNLSRIETIADALLTPVSYPEVSVSGNPASSFTFVNITSNTVIVDGGDTFVTYITLLPSEAVAGVQIDLIYDSTLLTVVTIQEGDFFTGYNNYFHPGVIDNLNGSITGLFNVILQPETGVTNPGIFASITFKANNKNGTSYLNLDNVLLGNPMAQKIPSKQFNGTITIHAKSPIPPGIQSISLPSYTLNDTITVMCKVSDPYSFNQLKAIVIDPNRHTTNSSLIPPNDGNIYHYTITCNLAGAYYLQIWAEDISGITYLSPPRIIMRYHLNKGWNMITVPMQHNFTAKSLSHIIGDKCDSIACWNSSHQGYDSHPTGTHIQNFPLKNGFGYYIHLWAPVSVTLSGFVLTSQLISLQKGYNLIGWPGHEKTTSKNLSESLTVVDFLAKWNADTQSYITYNFGSDDNIFQIKTGEGLFVHLSQNTQWFFISLR